MPSRGGRPPELRERCAFGIGKVMILAIIGAWQEHFPSLDVCPSDRLEFQGTSRHRKTSPLIDFDQRHHLAFLSSGEGNL